MQCNGGERAVADIWARASQAEAGGLGMEGVWPGTTRKPVWVGWRESAGTWNRNWKPRQALGLIHYVHWCEHGIGMTPWIFEKHRSAVAWGISCSGAPMKKERMESCCNSPGEGQWKHIPSVSPSWRIMIWNSLVTDVLGLNWPHCLKLPLLPCPGAPMLFVHVCLYFFPL